MSERFNELTELLKTINRNLDDLENDYRAYQDGQDSDGNRRRPYTGKRIYENLLNDYDEIKFLIEKMATDFSRDDYPDESTHEQYSQFWMVANDRLLEVKL